MSKRFDFGDGNLVLARVHENGGGMVALTAQVDPTVQLGVGCEVSGYAKIRDKVRISGRVIIIGAKLPRGVTVQIEDNAVISGSDIKISGRVLIRDRAEVRGKAKISGCVQMLHRSRVDGDVILEGNVKLTEGGSVTGKTIIASHGPQTIVRGDHCVNDEVMEAVIRCDNQRKPRVTALKPIIHQSIAA